MIDQPSFKTVLLCFFCWFGVHQLIAQPTFLRGIHYDSLLNQAREHDKPMFLVIHQRDESFSPFWVPISKETTAILQEQFVSGVIQLDPDDIDHPLHKTYHLTTPIYLFADKDGFPLLRHNKPITHEDTLVNLVDSALLIAQGETMGKLIQQYKKGLRNTSLLRSLLTQYQVFNQYTDQQVLDDYLSQLTIQELNNFETVVFLLRCGPVYNSKIYQLARTNHKMVDSLYATLPLPTRKKINNRIIQQTFREALNQQQQSLNRALGNFVYQTWHPHYLRAQMGRSYYPMEYARLLGDTTSYLLLARNYYNSFFNHIAPDSVARLDFANDRNIDIPQRGRVLDSTQNVLFEEWITKHRQRYSDEQARMLSYGARQLLNFGKDNSEALFDAIQWQRKAIVLRPERGQYHHTLAQLLYRVGFYAEAEVEQQQAITLSKPHKQRYKQMQEVLKQMRARLW